MLRIIFNDMVERGMTTIPKKVLENVTLESSLSDMLPNGDGSEAVFVIQYITKVGQRIVIKYLGTYSSWDKTTWYYMGYVPEPKPYIAYHYDVADIVSI